MDNEVLEIFRNIISFHNQQIIRSYMSRKDLKGNGRTCNFTRLYYNATNCLNINCKALIYNSVGPEH